VSTCPSYLALDERALHGGAGELEAHVASCARCQARLREREAAVADFGSALAAPTWQRAVAEARERARRRRRLWSFGAPLLAAGLAALIVIARPAAPPGPYLAAKGAPIAQVLCRRDGRTFQLAPSDEVRAGDLLRFRPLPVWPEARFIQIGSVDGTGRYTSFHPGGDGGASLPLPAPGQPLDGSTELDAAPGPERLFVVLSEQPLALADVRRVAEANAARREPVDRIAGVRVRSAWLEHPKRAGAEATP